MRTSIATVSVSGTLDAKLEAIAAAGFWGVEIFENDLVAHTASPREIARLMRNLGLVCVAYQPFRDFEGLPGSLRSAAFDRLERKFDLMQELGAPSMLVCSSVHPAASGDRPRIVADFQELGERAKRRGLRVGYEALAWGRHVNDHRDAWAIVRDAAHPAVGIILDSFHSFARAVPVESIREIDPAKIVFVQLADAPKLHMDELSWSRHYRTMPGQGDFPLVEYVRAIEDIGYRGVYSLEIFNDRFRAANTSTIAVDGRRSLTFLEDEVARSRGASIAPPRADCLGIEFIEIAANDVEAPQIGRILSTLGFSAAGRHRRKAVTRWTQGGINVVINSESEGFAHSHGIAHGASVCAVGLRVADAGATAARARALHVPTFSQPGSPGELEIPAVRGVGGSLIYFLDQAIANSVWTAEFEPAGASATDGAGLVAVDYIAQVMPYEEMFSSLLFYVSMFEVIKTPMIEFADPLGLVQSQAVESTNQSLRITLNASAANQTLTSRFLAATTGAGVQYVAFRSNDIFASAAQMRRAGVELLPIPANYYDDLGARFALDAVLLDRMRTNNILYDRDASGDYFHLVSRAFAKRLFFEIVERRNYAGYGAANAPVRLAAQARYKTAPGSAG